MLFLLRSCLRVAAGLDVAHRAVARKDLRRQLEVGIPTAFNAVLTNPTFMPRPGAVACSAPHLPRLPVTGSPTRLAYIMIPLRAASSRRPGPMVGVNMVAARPRGRRRSAGSPAASSACLTGIDRPAWWQSSRPPGDLFAMTALCRGNEGMSYLRSWRRPIGTRIRRLCHVLWPCGDWPCALFPLISSDLLRIVIRGPWPAS